MRIAGIAATIYSSLARVPRNLITSLSEKVSSVYHRLRGGYTQNPPGGKEMGWSADDYTPESPDAATPRSYTVLNAGSPAGEDEAGMSGILPPHDSIIAVARTAIAGGGNVTDPSLHLPFVPFWRQPGFVQAGVSGVPAAANVAAAVGNGIDAERRGGGDGECGLSGTPAAAANVAAAVGSGIVAQRRGGGDGDCGLSGVAAAAG